MEEKKELKNQSLEELNGLLKRLLSDKENKVDYIADAEHLEATYDVGTKTYSLSLKNVTTGKPDWVSTSFFDIISLSPFLSQTT